MYFVVPNTLTIRVHYNPWNQDTSLTRTSSSVPSSEARLERFHCHDMHVSWYIRISVHAYTMYVCMYVCIVHHILFHSNRTSHAEYIPVFEYSTSICTYIFSGCYTYLHVQYNTYISLPKAGERAAYCGLHVLLIAVIHCKLCSCTYMYIHVGT